MVLVCWVQNLGCTSPAGWYQTSGAGPVAQLPAWAFPITWIPLAMTRMSWHGSESRPQRHGGTLAVLKLPGLAVAQDCSQVEKRLQAAAGQLAGRSAVKGVTLEL